MIVVFRSIVLIFIALSLGKQDVYAQQGSPITKIYENSSQPFPNNLDGFKNVGHMEGGSGGVTVLQDRQGKKFTLKCATNPAQLKEEIMADALYRSMGVPVPGFAVYKEVSAHLAACQGQPLVRVSQFVESNPDATDQMKSSALAKGFVADAFMSNWDIVIGGFKNVILDKRGYLWRIDNGGSLRYRALGEAKKGHPGWDMERVTDLDTMRDPKKSSEGASVYGGLTPDEIRAQAQKIVARAPQILQALETVSRAIDIENPTELRAMLTGRLHDLQNRFGLSAQPNRQGQPTPSTYFAARLEKPTAHSAAGVLVYSVDPKTGLPMILLGKRIRHNWWGNLGGKSDVDPRFGPVDRSLMETAIRETREESQDSLIFSNYELEQSPSHDLINPDGSMFRMYIAPTRNLYPQNVPLTGPHYQEYTKFQWVPLRYIMVALDPTSPRIQEEGQETVQVVDIILHAPLYRMLMEPAVQAQLRQIIKNPRVKLKAIRTKTGYTGEEKVSWTTVDTSRSLEKVPFGFNAAGQMMGRRSLKGVPGSEEAAPYNRSQEEQQTAQTVARKSQLGGELASKMSKALGIFAPPERTYSESQKALAALPYIASDAYLQLMMRTDFDTHRQNPTELINLFFDKPYTAFGKKDYFNTPHFRNNLVKALQEERRHPGWYVFYHGTDAKLAFMYDILSTYRARFQDKHARANPRFRFLDQPFVGLENVDEFKAFFSGSKGTAGTNISNYAKDYENPQFKEGSLGKRTYQDMGLSVNVSLFGSDKITGSSSIEFFATGTTNTPPDYQSLFNVVRGEIGFERTLDDFEPLFEEYQRNFGRLYQIFIHPDFMDQIGYFAHSGGSSFFVDVDEGRESDKPTETISLLRRDPTEFQKKLSLHSAQSRLFLKPELFYNPEMVQVRVYNNKAADPLQEKAFWKKLDSMVTEDVTKWILGKEEMMKGSMGQGDQPLEQMAKQVYHGEAGIPFEQKDPLQRKVQEFFGLLEQGDIDGIRNFFKSNPDYPVSKPLVIIDYYNPWLKIEKDPIDVLLSLKNPNKIALIQLLGENKGFQNIPIIKKETLDLMLKHPQLMNMCADVSFFTHLIQELEKIDPEDRKEAFTFVLNNPKLMLLCKDVFALSSVIRGIAGIKSEDRNASVTLVLNNPHLMKLCGSLHEFISIAQGVAEINPKNREPAITFALNNSRLMALYPKADDFAYLIGGVAEINAEDREALVTFILNNPQLLKFCKDGRSFGAFSRAIAGINPQDREPVVNFVLNNPRLIQLSKAKFYEFLLLCERIAKINPQDREPAVNFVLNNPELMALYGGSIHGFLDLVEELAKNNLQDLEPVITLVLKYPRLGELYGKVSDFIALLKAFSKNKLQDHESAVIFVFNNPRLVELYGKVSDLIDVIKGISEIKPEDREATVTLLLNNPHLMKLYGSVYSFISIAQGVAKINPQDREPAITFSINNPRLVALYPRSYEFVNVIGGVAEIKAEEREPVVTLILNNPQLLEFCESDSSFKWLSTSIAEINPQDREPVITFVLNNPRLMQICKNSSFYFSYLCQKLAKINLQDREPVVNFVLNSPELMALYGGDVFGFLDIVKELAKNNFQDLRPAITFILNNSKLMQLCEDMPLRLVFLSKNIAKIKAEDREPAVNFILNNPKLMQLCENSFNFGEIIAGIAKVAPNNREPFTNMIPDSIPNIENINSFKRNLIYWAPRLFPNHLMDKNVIDQFIQFLAKIEGPTSYDQIKGLKEKSESERLKAIEHF